ncbi:glycosyl hydrolase, partial [Kibdelosporangium lantanae]
RIPAGGTSGPIPAGGFRAPGNGKYPIRATVTPDANEVPIKRANDTSSQDLYVGRGAAMPYDTYEAEDGVLRGGATVVGPNRTIGDLAGEASGRRAVTLGTPGSSVEFTTRRATNTLVARVSVPDGAEGTIGVYVNGKYVKDLNVTSRYAWLYGPETGPVNDPAAGPARHVYDEANTMLGVDVPAGGRIRLVRGSVPATVDFVSVERVAPVANPDPVRYVVPNGFTQEALQAALDKVRTDITGTLVGVYLPAGDYENSSKVRVDGTVKVVGAGPWFTRFHAPADADNTDAGFAVTANGSSFAGFSYWGNWTTRIDGPGKVFDLANVSNLTFDNLWIEHTVVGVWGTRLQGVTVENSRFRDLFADGVNFTNGSTRNHVVNNEARTTGDDSFALFAATDLGGGDQRDNLFDHLTATTPWRAAGVAAYGGQANTFKDVYVADTLAGPGLTVSSLSFGVTMRDFGPGLTTFEGVTLDRAGGHFFGAQTFPAVWLFSATTLFRGVRFDHVTITDPTYSGIMFQTNYVNGRPVTPITDTEFTDVTVSGAHRSGDQFDAKSGFGVWANELPEPGQGPAVGSAVFRGLRLYDNAVDVKNTTTTFTIGRS